MNVWLAISLILGVVAIYMLTIEIYSVAFQLTGLSTSKIRFQVASLFTSTGYTTAESELIAGDERRRKIAVACTYTGHIFSVVIMGLVINIFFSIGLSVSDGFQAPKISDWRFIIFIVTCVIFLLMLIIKIPPINKRFQRLLESIAINSSKKSRNTNIITVLDMYGKHAITEVVLNKIPANMKDVPLFQMGLTKRYSINVLSIRRGVRIIDVSKDTMFKKRDVLIIYGLINDIKEAFVNSIDKKEESVIIDRANQISLVNNYGVNALVEVYIDEVPKELENTKIKDSHLTDRYNITLAIIKRKEDYVYVDKDTIIQKGDTLTLFGPYKNIKLVFQNEVPEEKEKAE